jgi:spore coat protein U-like protein
MIRTAHMIRWLLATALTGLAAPSFAAYSCMVSSSGAINFLTYDPFGPAPTASATVTLTCTHLGGGNEFINWTMTLSNGSSGSCANRQMQRQSMPAATLDYNVYQGATSTVWGNGSCGSFPSGQLQVNNGNPSAFTTQTMRGVLPAGQTAPVGSYLDTLVLTVSF